MIAPIGGIAAATATAGTAATTGTATTSAVGLPRVTGAGDGSAAFGELVTDGLQQVSRLEFTADAAVQDLAAGGPTRIEDVMIATSQAELGIQMLARVRDRALEAYQEIMRMPL